MEYDLRSLSNKLTSMLDIAIEVAKQSTEEQRHGAVLFSSKPLSTACNEKRGSKVVDMFRRHNTLSTHAECGCLIKSPTSPAGSSLIVVRISRRGKLVNSKPCETCNSFMASYGIRQCFYSTERGTLSVYKPDRPKVYLRKPTECTSGYSFNVYSY